MDIKCPNAETHTDIPVIIDAALMEALTPNSYLSSLGITREQREINIKQLARASITPNNLPDNFHAQIPFMVAKGPFITEEFLSVNVSREVQDRTAVIVLRMAKEPEETDSN
jgi:hypothetical protein